MEVLIEQEMGLSFAIVISIFEEQSVKQYLLIKKFSSFSLEQ